MKPLIFSISLVVAMNAAIAQEVIDTVKTSSNDSIIMNETMKRKIETNEVKIEMAAGKNKSSITINQSDGQDTTRFRLGKTEIIVLEDKEKRNRRHDWNENDEKEFRNDFGKRTWKRPRFEGHFHSINAGVNLFSTKDLSISLPDTAKFLELDEGKSFEFGLNPFQFNIPIIPRALGIVSGVGLTWNNYRFDNPGTILDNSQPTIAYTIDTVSKWSKSKLSVWTVFVPLMLEGQVRLGHDQFWIAGGAYGTLKLGSKTKLKDDAKRKIRESKDYHINPLQYGLTARVGYGNLGVYANYSLSTFFKKNEGPELYPVSVGLTLTFN
jgi:hypothetical protein